MSDISEHDSDSDTEILKEQSKLKKVDVKECITDTTTNTSNTGNVTDTTVSKEGNII